TYAVGFHIRIAQVVLHEIPVVEWEQKADRRSRGERERAGDRKIGASLGLDLHVARVTAEAGRLKIVAEVCAFMRLHAVVAQVDVHRELRIGNDERLQRGIESSYVRKGVLDLNAIAERSEYFPERPVSARGASELAVAEDWVIRVCFGFEQKREDVELRPS